VINAGLVFSPVGEVEWPAYCGFSCSDHSIMVGAESLPLSTLGLVVFSFPAREWLVHGQIPSPQLGPTGPHFFGGWYLLCPFPFFAAPSDVFLPVSPRNWIFQYVRASWHGCCGRQLPCDRRSTSHFRFQPRLQSLVIAEAVIRSDLLVT